MLWFGLREPDGEALALLLSLGLEVELALPLPLPLALALPEPEGVPAMERVALGVSDELKLLERDTKDECERVGDVLAVVEPVALALWRMLRVPVGEAVSVREPELEAVDDMLFDDVGLPEGEAETENDVELVAEVVVEAVPEGVADGDAEDEMVEDDEGEPRGGEGDGEGDAELDSVGDTDAVAVTEAVVLGVPEKLAAALRLA